MQTFYVSLAADLLGVYIEYQAALRQYLERQYLRGGIWKLPWCAIYRDRPTEKYAPLHIVRAGCGTIYEGKGPYGS